MLNSTSCRLFWCLHLIGLIWWFCPIYLNYCNMIWTAASETLLNKLQVLQKGCSNCGSLSRAMDFCCKADHISYSASFNSGIVILALAAAYGKTLSSISRKRDNLVDWDRVNWGPLILGDEVAPVWLQPVLCDACRVSRSAVLLEDERNHSVATLHNLPPVLATVFMLRLPSPSHPQIIYAVFRQRTLRLTPWHEGQTFLLQPEVDEV